MCQITTALHHYPKRHGLSIAWIADHIGIPESTLGRYLSLNEGVALPFPLRLLIPFMKACDNDYSALDLLESRLGRTAHVTGATGKLNLNTISRIAKESGRTISILAESMSDGVIDEDEGKICTESLLNLQKEISTALVELNKKRG